MKWYYEPQEFVGTLGGQTIRVVSKPGLPDWNRVTPADSLLAQEVELKGDSHALVLGCGHGALGVALASRAPDGAVLLADQSAIALDMAARTLAVNNVASGSIRPDPFLLPDLEDSLDIIAFEPPKSRPLARRWLLEAHRSLKTGGRLYLAGPSHGGLESIVKDAEALFGHATVLQIRERNRVVRLSKRDSPGSSPDWASEPGIAPGSWIEFEIELDGSRRPMRSLPGVFASDRLDDGTRLLLSKMETPAGGRVLDIGCGYGIIGIAAALRGAGQVDLIDSDLLAVASAAENLRQLEITNARAFASDAGAGIRGQRYDLIASNPPFHTGKAVDFDMARAFMDAAASSLALHGRFLMVANRFLPYAAVLRTLFGSVETVAGDIRYQVFEARATTKNSR